MSELELSVKLKLAAEQFISALSGASAQFKQAMDGMAGSAAQAGNGIDAAFKTLGVRSGAEIRAEIDQIKAAFDSLKGAGLPMRDVEAAAQALKGKLAGLNAELRLDSAKAGAGNVSSMGQSFSSSMGSITAFAASLGTVYTAWNSAKSIFTAGAELQSLQAALKYATGDSAKAAEALAFVRKTANDLGIDAMAAAQGFKGISAAARGTALEGDGVRAIFLSIATASRVMGLTSDQMSGALLAIQQMMSKGVVAAEEFRGQLGERLPGATRIAAQAMGVTEAAFTKMLDTGQIIAKDFLPKFAAALQNEVGGAANDASNTASAALERLHNAWIELLQGIANSGFMDKAASGMKGLTEWVKKAGDNLETILPILGNMTQSAIIGWLIKFSAGLVEVKAGAVAAEAGVAALGAQVGLLDKIIGGLKFAVVVQLISQLVNLGNAHKELMQAQIGAESARQKVIDGLTAEQTAVHGVIVRTQEYSAVTVKSAQDFTAMSEIQQQGYRNALEGAKQYESAQLRTAILEKSKLDMMSESERKTIDYASAVGVADAAIKEHSARVRELNAELGRIGETQKSNISVSGQMDKSIADLSQRFTELQAKSGDVVAALKELKNVDLSTVTGGTAFLALLQSLGEQSKLTGKQIQEQIADRLQGMAAKDLPAFEGAAQMAFENGKISAQTLSDSLDQSLRAALKKLGLDLDAIKSGFSTAFSGAKDAFEAVALNASSTGATVRAAFDKMLDSAKTQGDVAALKTEFENLKASGKLSAAEIKDEFDRLQAKLNETAGQVDGALGDAFKRLGIKSAEAVKASFSQMVQDFNDAKASGIASAEGIAAAYDKIKASVAASVSAITQASREALQAAKEHTTAVQAATSAISAQAAASAASANASKADAEYERASAEAMKSGSESARAKADALGVAAQAAHSAADAAQADAVASQAAAAAAKAEEAAKIALAAAAASPSDATQAAAAAAQDYANKMAQGAEAAKQAASEAHAVASEMGAAASEAGAMAASVKDAGNSMGANWAGNMASDGTQVAVMTGGLYAMLVKRAYEAQKAISGVKTETEKLIAASAEGVREVIAFGFAGVANFNAMEKQAELYGTELAKTEASIKRNEDATKAWASAMDGLRGAAASLKDELDRALGNDKAIEDRSYEARKKALEDQYNAAKAAAAISGDAGAAGDAQQAYQHALLDLNQLHAINLKNIADAASAKSAADAKNHADELARIADERAARIAASHAAANTAINNASLSSASAMSAANNSYSTVNGGNTVNNNNLSVNVNGQDLLSEDQIRNKIAPVINKMMQGSR